MATKEEDRFFSKITPAENGCWIWDGPHNYAGYGDFNFLGTHTRAHIWSYNRWFGKVPDGLELDHLCDTKACVNPYCLEAVTHAENMRRAKWTAEGRARMSAAAKARVRKKCEPGCTCKWHDNSGKKCEPGCTCGRHQRKKRKGVSHRRSRLSPED